MRIEDLGVRGYLPASPEVFMSLRAPLFLLALAAVLSSRPAQAGRASACKAPPFAVPKETQRAVDAAINARVTGTGAGTVEAEVETRTEYETTTLSQDAVARAWAEYTVCLKLAKRMISQELHDELLRDLLSPATRDPQTPPPSPERMNDALTPPMGERERAPDAASLVGTWNVVSRFTEGSCPEGLAGGASAYIWVLSLNAEGEIVVAVQGHTSYDLLRGTYSGGRLRVGATVNSGGEDKPRVIATTSEGTDLALLPRSDFALTVEGDRLVGHRWAAMWSSTLTDDGTTLTILPCVLHYEVEATR